MKKRIVLKENGDVDLIAKEFRVNRITVWRSLKFIRNNELAESIRSRALELGAQEVEFPESKKTNN